MQPNSAGSPNRFNLIRYYVIASLAAVAIVAILSAWIFGALMRSAMVHEAERDAIDVARLMAAEFHVELETLTAAGYALQWHDPYVQQRLSDAFARSGGALGVIKIKAFDASGQIIHSTDSSLIGQIDASNPDFQAALQGRPHSELSRAERVADLGGEVFVADVIETYVPIADLDDILRVFEVYQDATDIESQVRAVQWRVTLIAATMMLVLFVALYLIVRRADRIIARQTDELAAANAELRELEQLKTDLTNMIVHDMKNPLTAIQGYASLLSRVGSLNESQAEFVQTIQQSTHRLLTMILNLLDISRLEEGKLELARQPVSVTNLVAPIVTEIEPQLRQENKSLSLEWADDLPPLAVDRALIERVIGNLVNNAAKHTESGGHIWIQAQRLPGNQVAVSVRDDGEGIPPEYQNAIFEKFRQAEGRRLGRKTDTGLGLAFCKLAVEAHGGAISVSSQVGQGSTFTVRLPAAG